MLKNGLYEIQEQINAQNESKQIFIEIQNHFECCGIESPFEWPQVKWFRDKFGDSTPISTQLVPSFPCKHQQWVRPSCSEDQATTLNDCVLLNLELEKPAISGCLFKMERIFKPILAFNYAIYLTIGFVLFHATALSIYFWFDEGISLEKNIKRIRRRISSWQQLVNDNDDNFQQNKPNHARY